MGDCILQSCVIKCPVKVEYVVSFGPVQKSVVHLSHWSSLTAEANCRCVSTYFLMEC